MRRRLSDAIGQVVRKHADVRLGSVQVGPLLADLEVELLKELPE
jgi:hypothetical protein